MALAANTVTPRPPLNLFEVARKELQGNTWFQIVQVPGYYVPKNGPIAAKSINAAAIMTGLVITNQHTSSIKVSARIKGVDGNYYTVVNQAPIPPYDFLEVSFQRQVMLTGETLEVSVPSNTGALTSNHATVHFSYIVNQREEFSVL